MSNLYLYLARRDKSAVRLLTVLQGPEKFAPTRVRDIRKIKMPSELLDLIAADIDKNKMLWEPWLESAHDYTELRSSLVTRGYRNAPWHLSVEYGQKMPSFVRSKDEMRPITVQIRPAEKRTMLRRSRG